MAFLGSRSRSPRSPRSPRRRSSPDKFSPIFFAFPSVAAQWNLLHVFLMAKALWRLYFGPHFWKKNSPPPWTLNFFGVSPIFFAFPSVAAQWNLLHVFLMAKALWRLYFGPHFGKKFPPPWTSDFFLGIEVDYRHWQYSSHWKSSNIHIKSLRLKKVRPYPMMSLAIKWSNITP